jgi:biopolymer transport protein ExbB/TolQ
MDRSASLAQPLDLRPEFSPDEPRDNSPSGENHSRSEREGAQHFAWMLAAAPLAGGRRYKYLLLLRFGLINLIGLGLLALAQVHGWVAMTLAADHTHLVAVIFLVFLAGLVICAYRINQTSRELNSAKPFDPLVPSMAAEFLAKSRGRGGESRAILISTLRLKLSQRIAVVRNTANSLVLLGLIGTVVGFIIALSGVDPAKAGDFNSVAPMVSTLIDGMSTALYTTLVGAVLNLWLMTNYQILATGTVRLITTLQERGAANE